MQTNKEKLIVAFKKICRFCERYENEKKSISAGSPEGRDMTALLNRFSGYLARSIPRLIDCGLVVDVSRARPSMPKVPWVGIVKKGRFVGTSLSVTVCFDRAGKGAVAGLMQPASGSPRQGLVPKNRTADPSFVLNVDGSRAETHYNNRFMNPEEFLAQDLDHTRLISHLDDSISRLLALD